MASNRFTPPVELPVTADADGLYDCHGKMVDITNLTVLCYIAELLNLVDRTGLLRVPAPEGPGRLRERARGQ